MAVRTMTFSVPEPLAASFLRKVPSRDRSRFVTEALAAGLVQRDLELICSCEAANLDLDVAKIEKKTFGCSVTEWPNRGSNSRAR